MISEMSPVDTAIADISQFADPYTEVKARQFAGGSRLEMLRGSRDLHIEVRESGRVSELLGKKRTFPTVESFIASERLADLSKLAATQLRALKAKTSQYPPIPAHIRIHGKMVSATAIADGWNGSSPKLQLLLFNGPAGIGKTFQIETLVSHQAARHVDGIPVPPVLHVNSQGRRLSSLRDVLAATTQDLDTSFSARQVPLLVRRGLLVVAVDGFDELVDADGYEDSWLALRQFLGDVGGTGSVILAARDTFVDEQELLDRIQRSRKQVKLLVGDILPPTPNQAREWLAKSPNWKPAELDSDLTADILREGSYGLRPFFLRELWAAKGWTDVIDSGPRTYLVNRLLLREAKIIAKSLGGITAESIEGPLLSLLQEVAMEMATRELDTVEIEHVSFLTQLFFEDSVDELAIRKLMHKSGSLALLELTGDKSTRRFPHSEIRHYFFGSALLREISAGRVPALLRRHMLNAEQADVFAEVFANNSKDAIAAMKVCSSILGAEVASDSLAPNLAALLFVGLSLGYVDRLDFADLIEATFAGQSPKGMLTKCSISKLDARGADISSLIFDDVRVDTLVVDDGTVIGDSMPEISAVELHGESVETKRSPTEVQQWLAAQRMGGSREFESPSVTLLQKVARRAVRHFYLRAGREDEGSTLLDDPLWPRILKVLQRHDRVDIHRARPMHGRPSPLIRVKNPISLLDVSNRQTAQILSELVAADQAPRRAPAKRSIV